MIHFEEHSFSDLTAELLYAILKLRQDVFIIEQDCIYSDIDNIDQHSHHLCLFFEDKLAAYSRLVPGTIKFENPSIGRIVVNPKLRGKRFGRKVVNKSIEVFKMRGEKIVCIEAQTYLLKFYRSFGFEERSDIYDLDGIPHVKMELKL